MNIVRIAAAAALLASSSWAHASDQALGESYEAVNGTTIRCPVPIPPSAEQRARQFETAPLDLDELSEMVSGFADPDNPQGAEFRARQAEQRASDWPFLCRYRDANSSLQQSAHRPVAVFMGDSITEGWIDADPEFFDRHDFADRGISGQSSPQMVARFYQDVIELRPEVVHIMTGTNDIGGATGAITEDEYIGYVRSMIDMARANDIAVVLGSIPPMTMLLPRPEFDVRLQLRSMNARLEALSTQYDIPFVDYYTPLADENGVFDARYANDGVHPTSAGYAVMRPLAEQAIAEALAQSAADASIDHIHADQQ